MSGDYTLEPVVCSPRGHSVINAHPQGVFDAQGY